MNHQTWYSVLLNKWPDLIVTFLGVFLGGLIAAWIAKWQMITQTNQDKNKANEIVETLVDRCRLEIRDNKNSLTQLQEVLDKTQEPNEMHYEWIYAITSSFKRAAYDDLLKLRLNHNMPKKTEKEIFTSFDMLEGLNYRVKGAHSGFRYYKLYGGNWQNDILIPFKNIKTYTATVKSHLEYVLANILKN